MVTTLKTKLNDLEKNVLDMILSNKIHWKQRAYPGLNVYNGNYGNYIFEIDFGIISGVTIKVKSTYYGVARLNFHFKGREVRGILKKAMNDYMDATEQLECKRRHYLQTELEKDVLNLKL
jgi:hypothetical protein